MERAEEDDYGDATLPDDMKGIGQTLRNLEDKTPWITSDLLALHTTRDAHHAHHDTLPPLPYGCGPIPDFAFTDVDTDKRVRGVGDEWAFSTHSRQIHPDHLEPCGPTPSCHAVYRQISFPKQLAQP
ncbi:hypothetical protein GLOTRDRAFT_133951 [Gloeophyllum trabeum ATCC 11539]|uniref:Uncharacterized protein n=1 Tax=Gloeophyllum trabeum (strain ATCC 11539 / FP-39264 / Madison 617) TaxID=670483 RepID=S7PSK1_GLOTA|nr:uncharacterized protein GLOTRDRAFT_133951 [Gloeophyllum trabeum ATCC 11539]EPQ50398.1 hypothetical protein GLOTRDRAFT_133951 [Gloeophyllum trabeum ATCC 11539]